MDPTQFAELNAPQEDQTGPSSPELVSEDDDDTEVQFVPTSLVSSPIMQLSPSPASEEPSFFSSFFSPSYSATMADELGKITERLKSFGVGSIISQQRQTAKREAEETVEKLNANRSKRTWAWPWEFLYPFSGTFSLFSDESTEAKEARFREFHRRQQNESADENAADEQNKVIQQDLSESQKRVEQYKKRQEQSKQRHAAYLGELKKEGRLKGETGASGIDSTFAYLVPKAALTSEQEQLLEDKFACGMKDDVVVERFNAPLTKHCFRTLNYGCWVNDEIVNAYLQMCEARGGDRPDRPYVFSSFFLPSLIRKNVGYTYAEVQRWTARGKGKADLFARRAVIFPINISNTHWCLAVVDIKFKRIYYYDSMGGEGREAMETLLRYLQDEHQAKKGQPLPDKDSWKMTPLKKQVPQQSNCNDCGVFTCSFANVLMEFFLKEAEREPPTNIFCFSAKDMPRIRQQMQLDLLRSAVFPQPDGE